MAERRPQDDNKPKVSISGDLLELEHNATALEKRLLVWNKGSKVTDARDLLRGPPTIGPTPESSVLGRIKSFLPTLEEANRKLFSGIEANGAEQFSIEKMTEGDGRYVEMDLALGVADLHTPEAVAAAELAANGQVIQMDRRPSCFDNSSDCESDEEEGQKGTDMDMVLEFIRAQEMQKQTSTIQEESKGQERL